MTNYEQLLLCFVSIFIKHGPPSTHKIVIIKTCPKLRGIYNTEELTNVQKWFFKNKANNTLLKGNGSNNQRIKVMPMLEITYLVKSTTVRFGNFARKEGTVFVQDVQEKIMSIL